MHGCGPDTYAGGHDKEISLFTWGYGSWSTDPDTEEYLPGVVGGADFGPTQDWGSRLGDGALWRNPLHGEFLPGATPKRMDQIPKNRKRQHRRGAASYVESVDG